LCRRSTGDCSSILASGPDAQPGPQIWASNLCADVDAGLALLFKVVPRRKPMIYPRRSTDRGAAPTHSWAGVAELVDARDLGSRDESRGGSSPSARTTPGAPPVDPCFTQRDF